MSASMTGRPAAEPAPNQNSANEYSPANADTSSPGTSLLLDRSMIRNRAEGAAPPKVEHYEMLTLTCRDVSATQSVHSLVINDSWDFLSKPTVPNALNEGKCVFRFMCSPMNAVDAETKEMINSFINVSSFKDEERENNTPRVDVYNAEDASKYIGIFVKAMYVLPGVKLPNITADCVASLEYQKACQPSGSKVEEGPTANSFRVTMSVIKFVFSLTIQFKVSEVTDPQTLLSFKNVDGMIPAKVIVLERTKRNVGKVDATAKVRSLLLYYPINDGVLVNSQTLVLNTSLPKVVSKIVNTFGSQGAAQSADTTKLTRRFLTDKFGDSRIKKG
ncbi:hypothetical protein STCU_06787 [Strigomonas culicis]|nr:hypothetical protein STCU_06787 [Strigomonas culicis]|eukprot:EPY25211.1 hypothetical protein STCU_06787 [Strigomonas culicis]